MKMLFSVKILATVAIVYFAMHFLLSRISERVTKASGYPGGYYYIPISPGRMSVSPQLQQLESILAFLFKPCAILDSAAGGPDHAFAPMLGLSDGNQKKAAEQGAAANP